MERGSGMWKIYLRLLMGPVLGIVAGSIAHAAGMTPIMSRVLGVTILKIFWWLDGCVRMGITGLLPIVLLPLLGVSTGNRISQLYFSDGMVLCLGSLLMASAIEGCQLHILAARWVSRYAMNRGIGPTLLVFIMFSGFMSMWISNTATAALMLPVANAFLISLSANSKDEKFDVERVGIALDLSIAFSVSLGGMATLIGTGSNIVLVGVMRSIFGDENQEVTFLGWFVMAAPLAIINLGLLWVLVCSCFLWDVPLMRRYMESWRQAPNQNHKDIHGSPVVIAEDVQENPLFASGGNLVSRAKPSENATAKELPSALPSALPTKLKLPSNAQESDKPIELNYKAKAVMITFAGMTLLWVTRDPPGNWGWAPAFGIKAFVTDGTVAMMACLFLMILPAEPLRWPGFHGLASGAVSTLSTTLATPRSIGRQKRYQKATSEQEGHSFEATSVHVHDHEEGYDENNRHLYNDEETESKNGEIEMETIVFDHDRSHTSYNPGSPHNTVSGVSLADRSGSAVLKDEMDEVTLEDDKPSLDSASRSNEDSLDDLEQNSKTASLFTELGSTSVEKAMPSLLLSPPRSSSSSPPRTRAGDHHTRHKKSYEAVLPWTAVQHLNWDVIFLLGGGFALSDGFEASGLSVWISNLIMRNGPDQLPGFITIASILSCMVTNVLSNVAAANVLLPSLACVGPHYGRSPLLVLMPVTLSISLALLFPMGTPPNAIVMTNKRVTTTLLLKFGILCTLCFLTTIILYCTYLMPAVTTSLNHVSTNVAEVCQDP